jgi:single-strand DNA-binding protein
MASYNRVVLLGNLTRDPDLKYLEEEIAVSNIGLAVNDRVKKDNQWVDETTFVDVTLWGRNAEVAGQYLTKGSAVLIEGRLKYETWENNGQKRSRLKVVGQRLQMLRRPRNAESDAESKAEQQDVTADAAEDDVSF